MRSDHKNNYDKYYDKYPNFQGANLTGVIFVDFLEKCLNYQRNYPHYSLFHENDLDVLNSRVYYRDGILIFRGANCQGANFEGVEKFVLQEAEFQSAKCQEANFQGVNLRGAQFQGADLKNANLKSTVLRGARLEGANLRNTNLQFADFHECTLEGAKLQEANLTECKDWNIAKWIGAEYDQNTKFPDDFIPENYGLIKKTTTKQSNNRNRQANSNNIENLQLQTNPQLQTTKQITKACNEIKKYIQNRQGQAEFRRELLKRYDYRCAITGCRIIGVLEAAHVIPYSVSQQENNPENGILLRADLHTLFDLNIIVIHPTSKKIEIRSDSPELDKMLRISEYQKFNGLVLPSYEEFEVCPHYDYLKWRYDNYGHFVKKYINVENSFRS
jgi:uncharacterized protein YjbI with pentapeptide repeats